MLCECRENHGRVNKALRWLYSPEQLPIAEHTPGTCPATEDVERRRLRGTLGSKVLCHLCFRRYQSYPAVLTGEEPDFGVSLKTIFRRSGGHGMSADQLGRLRASLRAEIKRVERLRENKSYGLQAVIERALLTQLEAFMAGTSTDLVVRRGGDLTTYSRQELDTLRELCTPGCTDPELALFLVTCEARKLNPFARQVYGIRRRSWDSVAKREVWKLVIQTGIDGYRTIAARRHDHAGTDDPTFGPMASDPTVVGGAHPEWACCTVYKIVLGLRCAYSARVDWIERVQTIGKAGEERPTDAWRRMPKTMLGKCAEALALRRAFPEQLGDLEFSVEERPPGMADVTVGTWIAEDRPAPLEAPVGIDRETGEMLEEPEREDYREVPEAPAIQAGLSVLDEGYERLRLATTPEEHDAVTAWAKRQVWRGSAWSEFMAACDARYEQLTEGRQHGMAI